MKAPFLLLVFFLAQACTSDYYNDGAIKFEPRKLTPNDKRLLMNELEKDGKRYDKQEKLLTKKITEWRYHIDSPIGSVVHDVRASLWYADLLLDYGDPENIEKAFEIIFKAISLQDSDTTSASCGVWPYFLEEPLKTKKSPVDYNWADFNAVTLLSIWMGHNKQLPEELKVKIKTALILAAKSIQKRDITPSYTNIAIMGTYVTYSVSHLFQLVEMQQYASDRLKKFYEYTIANGGFNEFNSPTYTMVALDEVSRMRNHIIHPTHLQMVDSIYILGWDMVARHYHKPSMQWAGPHSRTYSNFRHQDFYSILHKASQGQIDLPKGMSEEYVKVDHEIPEHLISYFVDPVLPRTETDTFDINAPEIIGTCYVTDRYVLSTANLSSLWNQRRPLLAYWGNPESPKYMQMRFLHDGFDFCSAIFQSQQKENLVLGGVHFAKESGDKHPHIHMEDSKFSASDLCLRFEFRNIDPDEILLPSENAKELRFQIGAIQFELNMLFQSFAGQKMYWRKGTDGEVSWIDLVCYSGQENEFDLNEISEAALGFALVLAADSTEIPTGFPNAVIEESLLIMNWDSLHIEVNVKPSPRIDKFI